MGIVGKGFIALLAVGTVVGALTAVHTPPPTAAEQSAQDGAVRREAAAIEAKRVVRSVLRDPGSAEFDHVTQLSNGVVCGYVNARNGFGGYVGREAFMFGQPVGGLMMEEQGSAAFTKTWEAKCIGQWNADYDADHPMPSGTRRITSEQRKLIMKNLSPTERRELARLNAQQK
ncbi:MAG: hypothetical protein WCA78_13980 [Rhizomicrobium sp.]